MAIISKFLYCQQYGANVLSELAWLRGELHHAPAAVFVLATLFCIYKYSQRPAYIDSQYGFSVLAKLALAGSLAALNLSTYSSSHQWAWHLSSDAAFALSEGLCLLLLVYTSHFYSPAPSRLLSIYLPVDICLKVTPILSWPRGSACSFWPIVLRCCLLILNEQSKWSQISAVRRQQLHERDALGFWEQSLFIWVVPLLFKARSYELRKSNLMRLTTSNSSITLHHRFQAAWAKYNRDSQHKSSLFKLLLKTHWLLILQGSIATLLGSALKLSLPFFIEHFTRQLGNRSFQQDEHADSMVFVYQLASYAFLLLFSLMIVKAYSAFLNTKLNASLRGMITSALFAKVLRLSDHQAARFNGFTLLSDDLTIVENSSKDLQDVCTSLITATASSVLLWQAIGLNMIAALAFTLGSSYICGAYGKRVAAHRQAWNNASRNRASDSAKLIDSVKYAKMTDSTGLISTILMRWQETELSSRTTFMKNDMIRFSFIVPTHAVAPLFAIGKDLSWSGAVTDIPALLKSIALIYWFSEDVGLLLRLPDIWATAMAAFSRFENVLHTPNHNKAAQTIKHINLINGNTTPIVFEDASIAPAEECRAALVDVSMSIPRGSLTVVSGKAGSGKTTFARAIIGRATRTRGSVAVTGCTIGYCSEDDWLLNKSVRDNIIGGNIFDRTWYTSVVVACVLSEDIALLLNGDDFVVGPLGANLEHNVRQKIALARAVYSKAPLIVLDNALSAQSSSVSKRVISQLFSTNGLLKNGTTVVLTTCHPEPFQYVCDQHWAIDNGRHIIRKYGLSSHNHLREIRSQNSDNAEQDQVRNGHRPGHNQQAVVDQVVSQLRSQPFINASVRQRVSYWTYLRQLNPRLVFIWLLLLSVTTVLETFPGIYLRIWLDPSIGVEFSHVYGFVVTLLSGLFFGSAAYVFYVPVANGAAENFHRRVLQAIVGSSVAALTPNQLKLAIHVFNEGIRITTRDLPPGFFHTTYGIVSLITAALLVASVHSSALAMLMSVAFALYAIRKMYCSASQQLKALQLELDGKLYAEFTETVAGVAHIQCLRMQQFHLNQAQETIDDANSICYHIKSVEAWMKMMTDATTMLLITAFVYILALADLHPHLAGLSLFVVNYSIQPLPYIIQFYNRLDMAMIGLQQLEEFIVTMPQAPPEEAKPALPTNWPTKGVVEFQNVTIGYNLAVNNPIISNATFTLSDVRKAAIHGPRRSGKTTLILSTILLLPYAGSIKIDGIEARDIPRDKFKEIFTIIPEKPVIFPSASIRQNLLTREIMNPIPVEGEPGFDAAAALLDDDLQTTLLVLERILRGVGLWDIVESRGGLNSAFSAFAFSSTQLQKFSLAQGITKYYFTRTKMTIIDSATSHVSAEGLERMKSLIDEIMGMDKECMVITTSTNSDAIEGSQYVARVAGGRVFKFFTEGMLRERVSSSMAMRLNPVHNAPAQNRRVVRRAERREQDEQQLLRPVRIPNPLSPTRAPLRLRTATGSRLAAMASSSTQAVSPRERLYQPRRKHRAGRRLAAVAESQPPEVQQAGPAPPSDIPEVQSDPENGQISQPPKIPSWMNDFVDDNMSGERRQQLYAMILEFGTVRLLSLLLETRLREMSALSALHQIRRPAHPLLLQHQLRERQDLWAYHQILESAVLSARAAGRTSRRR